MKNKPVLKPGDLFHMDHFVSRLPGRVINLTGTPTNRKYTCGLLAKDHFSRKIFVEFQEEQDAEQSIQAKRKIEQECLLHDVHIKRIHADNGIFNTNKWTKHLQENKQYFSFCGAGAHHQSPIAERGNRTVIELARTMLLEAHSMWPEHVDFDLWPFAVAMAIDVYNNTPQKDLNFRTPNEVFAGYTKQPDTTKRALNSFHPFGCPVFVLAKRLQDGQKLPKWEAKSRQAIHLGHSKYHA